MFSYNVVLVLDVLQDLSHNIRQMLNVFCGDGGNIPSVTKVGLARSCGCFGVQSEF